MDRNSIESIVQLMKAGDYSAFESLPSEERALIEQILKEISSSGKSRILDALWDSDFKRKPVSIDQFLDDDYYLGKVGRNVYPLWRRELKYVFDPSREIGEWILRGSIGCGKTSIAVISLLYKIHQLICMKNPQNFYNLVDRSPIVFGLFNIYKYLAQDTSYNYLQNWTKLSPFFVESRRESLDTGCNCWRCKMQRQHQGHVDDVISGYISYPNHITIALGSSAIHALGRNLLGGLCDEADLGKSKGATDDEKSQIADLYSQVRARIDSRFMQKSGSNPGLLLLASQVGHKESFMEEHVKKVQNNPHTHVTAFALWEAKSDQFDLTKMFKVVVGNQRIRSFIPTREEEIKPSMQVIEVPEQLRPRFEYDIDQAIRDLAGIPIFGTNLFLSRRDKLFECYSNCDREHPFFVDAVELSIDDDDLTIVSVFDKNACMVQHDKSTGAWKPKWFAGVDRAIHVDLSVKKDCTGIACGCIGDIKEVTRFDQDERPYTTRDYVMFIDFALRIKAVKGSEIDFSKIRQFIFYLSHIGFPIKWVSFDGFQSVDSLQILKKANYDGKLLSVDKKPFQYNYLKTTIYENRLDIYEYEPFTEEITKLVDNTLLKKKPPIDHLPKGKKDVSDAVCGVVARLLEEKGLLKPQPSRQQLDNRLGFHFEQQKRDQVQQLISPRSWLPKPKKNTLESLFDED